MLPFKNWLRNEGDSVLNHHCSGFTAQLHWAALEMSPQLSADGRPWHKEPVRLLLPLAPPALRH